MTFCLLFPLPGAQVLVTLDHNANFKNRWVALYSCEGLITLLNLTYKFIQNMLARCNFL